MLFETIAKIVAKQFACKAEEITPQTRFVEDLEADSLDVVELTIEMEDRFAMEEVPEEELKKLRTVGDLVQYVQAHSNA